MTPFTKIGLMLHALRWVRNWNKRDLDYRPAGLSNPKFVTARQAAEMFDDGNCVFSSGMAGGHRNSIFFWALRDRFEHVRRPKNLTWITVGAQGGRGKAPGTIEELALPGLVQCYIAGHSETMKANLDLAEKGACEFHLLPQGVITFLLEAQARGEDSIISTTGLGTFLDSRVGRGSVISRMAEQNLVRVVEGGLRYRMPRVDRSMFVAPAADEEGNIYMRNSCMHTETIEAALAVRANGGRNLVSVAEIVPKCEADIYLPAECVDAIVVNPRNEQAATIPQRKYWPMFTEGANVDVAEALQRVRFINHFLKITPPRGPIEDALARLAAGVFVDLTPSGSCVNIGVGLPEEVGRLLFESGLYKDVTFTTETGVLGGVPTPGIFFGQAINPVRFLSSAKMFHHYEANLQTAVLGLLEADSHGNVNVSRRGPRADQVVGTGGFPDIVATARHVVFVGTWMAHAKMAIDDGRLRILKPGEYKFCEAVSEITFNGPRALARGQTVHYVTNVGVFQLTSQGMMLRQVMPGIDVERDILAACPMRIALPEGGHVPVVASEIVTGRDFSLAWKAPAAPDPFSSDSMD